MNAYLQQLTARNDPGLTDILQSSHVGIAGCGGLGSNSAVALTRTGIGALTLADFDVVETSNLNRQHYFIEDIGRPKVDALEALLRRINPEIRIKKFGARLDEINVFDVFGDCAVIAEAFHAADDKAMLLTAFSDGRFREKHLVCASGMAGSLPANEIRTHRLARNIHVCGDLRTGPDEQHGLMAPRVMITAGHQANTIVRILAGAMN